MTRKRWRAGDYVALIAGATVLIALVFLGLEAAGSGAGSPRASEKRTLCTQPGGGRHNPGAYVDGKRYWVEDDRFGADPKQCVQVVPHGQPGFVVSASKARNPGATAVAYPFIQYGCYWGWCTPGSGLPLRVSAIRTATSTWDTREHAGGVWDTAYDLWLNSTRLAHGHANRGEVMVWLNAASGSSQVARPAGARLVRAAGREFYLSHWRAGTGIIPGGWDYVQYRLAEARTRVQNIDLKAVLLDAVRRHLISGAWYLQGILAGNEIWRGGTGLATTRFSATVTGRRPGPTQ
jgi:hypothetical protein